ERAAVEEGFLDDDGRVLPPDGGNDRPVDGAHQARHLAVLVSAVEAHARARTLDERLDLLLERPRLALKVAAEDHELGIVTPDGFGDPPHRVEQHVDALEGRDLAEIGEAAAPPA